MALIGQVFGDQSNLMDQARQMAAAADYQRAFAQSQYQQQQHRGLSGLGSGSLQQNTLSNKPTPKAEKKESVMDYMKGYFFKHRELLMGFTLIVLLDHFIFAGAFREKTQRIVQALLDKTEKQLIG